MQINSRLLYNALQKQAAQAAEQSFTTGTDRNIGFALGLQKAAGIVFELTHSVGLYIDVIRIYSELYVETDNLVGEYFEAANPPEALPPLLGEIEGLLRAREVVDVHRRAAEAEQAAVEADEPPEPKPEVFYPYED